MDCASTEQSINQKGGVLHVKTNQSNATSKKDSQTMLSKLNFNNINLSNTPQTVANCNNFLDSVLSFTTIKQFDEWIAEQGIDVASYNGWYKNNDCFVIVTRKYI